jgi:mannitol-1-phosphate/altronate dehydrogenase
MTNSSNQTQERHAPRVTFEGQALTIQEARQKMDPAIVERIAAQHPNWSADEQSADAFVRAYQEQRQAQQRGAR